MFNKPSLMKRILFSAFICMCAVASALAQIGIAVDLGLPSGTKWATCNIGASLPEEFGDYFAWGEVEVKLWYSSAPYAWYTLAGETGHYTKYYLRRNSGTGFVDGLNELEEQDDVANVRWGKQWRIPSSADLDELIMLCTWKWTKLNKVKGYTVIGPNGNSIFLPAAGMRMEYDLKYDNNGGYYYTRSLCKDSYNVNNADYLYFDRFDKARRNITRFCGYTIRPVCYE